MFLWSLVCLSLGLFVCSLVRVFFCLFVCLLVCLSFFSSVLFVCIPTTTTPHLGRHTDGGPGVNYENPRISGLCVCLLAPFFCLSGRRSICTYICMFVCLLVYLPVYLSICWLIGLFSRWPYVWFLFCMIDWLIDSTTEEFLSPLRNSTVKTFSKRNFALAWHQ